jgi:hypothetical protein
MPSSDYDIPAGETTVRAFFLGGVPVSSTAREGRRDDGV